MEVAEPAAILDVSGPMTVKEVEALVFVAARGHSQLEVAQRTWLEDDRSYFVRWRENRKAAPLQIVGLVHAFELPEMASQVTVVPFDGGATPALNTYAELLLTELKTAGFA